MEASERGSGSKTDDNEIYGDGSGVESGEADLLGDQASGSGDP